MARHDEKAARQTSDTRGTSQTLLKTLRAETGSELGPLKRRPTWARPSEKQALTNALNAHATRHLHARILYTARDSSARSASSSCGQHAAPLPDDGSVHAPCSSGIGSWLVRRCGDARRIGPRRRHHAAHERLRLEGPRGRASRGGSRGGLGGMSTRSTPYNHCLSPEL